MGREMGKGQDWISFVSKVGAPAAIAFLLVWFLTQDVSKALAGITVKLDGHVLDMKAEQLRTRFLLKAICDNSADDERESVACAEAVE
jgi:hypothetical protein